MTRWSLGNSLMPISHEQFIDLTTQFKKTAEQSFGTECRLQIRALNDTKKFTTFWDDDLQRDLDEENRANTILETANLSDVTKSLWKKAAYLEVTVRPIYENHAPKCAFGHVEFKGARPRQATFYLQPDGEDAKKSVLAQNRDRYKWVGDGFTSNGSRNPRPAASLAGLFAPH